MGEAERIGESLELPDRVPLQPENVGGNPVLRVSHGVEVIGCGQAVARYVLDLAQCDLAAADCKAPVMSRDLGTVGCKLRATRDGLACLVAVRKRLKIGRA